MSRSLAIGSLLLMRAMVTLVAFVDHTYPGTLPWLCVSLFVLAWIGQFVGHAIEGRRPFEDLQFLLIGPIWLLSSLYRRFGIPV